VVGGDEFFEEANKDFRKLLGGNVLCERIVRKTLEAAKGQKFSLWPFARQTESIGNRKNEEILMIPQEIAPHYYDTSVSLSAL
jgi:hypothetical protein